MSKKSKTAPAAPTAPTNPGDTATPAVPATPKKRGRKSLGEADKAHMQQCRKDAAAAKARLTLVLKDDGILDPAAWNGLPAGQFDRICTAMATAKKANAAAALSSVRQQYEDQCAKAGITPEPAIAIEVPKFKKVVLEEAEKQALADARATVTNGVTLGLLDEHVTDYRLWQDVPSERLAKIMEITSAQQGTMATKGASAAKAAYDALCKELGVTPAAPAPANG